MLYHPMLRGLNNSDEPEEFKTHEAAWSFFKQKYGDRLVAICVNTDAGLEIIYED